MSATFSNTPETGIQQLDGMTVRPLTQSDTPEFDEFCSQLPMRTLTPRLNIEVHGFQGPIVRSWGVFGSTHCRLSGLLLRFGNTAVAVDADGSCARIFARLIDGQSNIAGVRGSVEVVGGIQALLRAYCATDWEDSYFLTLKRPVRDIASTAFARRAVPEDVEQLTALYSGAGTMYRSRSNVAAKLSDTRVFVVEEPATQDRESRIASCALLNVEGNDAGLVGGVYTLPSARGKGYAAACTAKLAADLQQDGKMPCLFYENPIAGKVYRRLGFEDASRWAVLYLVAQKPRAGR